MIPELKDKKQNLRSQKLTLRETKVSLNNSLLKIQSSGRSGKKLSQTWFQHGPNVALAWSQNVDTIDMSLIQ